MLNYFFGSVDFRGNANLFKKRKEELFQCNKFSFYVFISFGFWQIKNIVQVLKKYSSENGFWSLVSFFLDKKKKNMIVLMKYTMIAQSSVYKNRFLENLVFEFFISDLVQKQLILNQNMNLRKLQQVRRLCYANFPGIEENDLM